MSLLEVKKLSVAVGDREILHAASIGVKRGETVVLLGQNGAGKSTLGAAIMGAPGLKIMGGKIKFNGQDITELTSDKRAKLGVFMAMQNPVEIPGVSLKELLRTAGGELKDEYLKALKLSPFLATRDLNVGFSGGEKKKAEILQMMCLKPKLAILDETDSGLDVDAARVVSQVIADYQKQTGMALLIVTHNARILQKLKVDKAYVLAEGRVIKEGDGKLVKKVERDGFKAFVEV